MNLNVDQTQVVCEAIKDMLPSLIKSAHDFKWVVQSLSAEQCQVVCEALKDMLPKLIKSATGFQSAIYPLCPKQCQVVCEALKDTLLKLFPSTKDIKALSLISDAQKAVLLDAFNRHQSSTLAVSRTVLSYKHFLEAKIRRLKRRKMAFLGVNLLEDKKSPRKHNMP